MKKSKGNPCSSTVSSLTAVLLALVLTAGVFSGCFRAKTDDPTPTPDVTQTVPPTAAPTPIPPETGEVSVAPSALGEVEIIPLGLSADGVMPDSQFLLKSAVSITADDLAARLSVRKAGEPLPVQSGGAKPFTVARNSGDGEYMLTFSEPLAYGVVYNLVYTGENKAPLSYAFQTAGRFAVTGTTPGMWTYNAPVDTGIEITLNRAPAADFADHFSIVPYVAGRFEQAGNKIVFVPEGLRPGAGYTVTIGKGLKSMDGETLGEDYEFRFYTEDAEDARNIYVTGDARLSFIPDDGVYFNVYAASGLGGGDFDVNVYDLKTADAFITADEARPPENAAIVSSFTTKLIPDGDYGDIFFFVDPVTPAPGYYYYEIKTASDGKEYACGKLAQVSYLSVYSLAINGEEVFWVHDTKVSPGVPASGAKITAGEVQATAGADGTARVNIGKTTDSSVRVDYADYPAFIYGQQTFDRRELPVSQRYFSYLYTDRSSYKKNDTVDIFGIIRPLRSEYALKSADTVEIRFGDMLSLPVKPDAYGAFSLKIPVRDMFGYVRVGIFLNNEPVQSSGVYFLDYNRDGYVLGASLDRHTYAPGETAKVGVSVSTFDGAPVEGVRLRETNGLADMLTDAAGGASCELPIKENPYERGWRPFQTSASFSVYGQEDYSQYLSAPYYVVPSDIMLNYTNIAPDTLEFTANRIDRQALEKWAADTLGNVYYPDESVYTGAPVDLDFTLTIERHSYTAVKTGEYYDFIQKRNVPKYDYNRETDVHRVINARLRNGRLVLDGLPERTYDPYVYYTATAVFSDSAGRRVELDVSLGGYCYPTTESPANRRYYFMSRRAGESEYRSYGTNLFVDEAGGVRVGYDGMPPDESLPGVMLLIPTRDSVLDVSVGDPNGAPFRFKEDWISSVTVYGAYFDGKHMHAIRYPMGIYYDSSERGLYIDVSFDRDKYGPGDEVTATVRVTGPDGNPRKALVNVSVVDEAVFGPSPHEAHFLSNLYGSAYYYGSAYSYTSLSLGYYVYSSHDKDNVAFNMAGGGAEMGSGGDSYAVRKDFTDNPGFVTAETDAGGVAAVAFALSDGITSWRVTTHAITMDNRAGNVKANCISTMPYYLGLVMPDVFLKGDEIGALVKSFGAEYRLNETQTEYAIEITQNGGTVFSGSQVSASYAQFVAGRLPAGDYTVTVYADYGGGHTDAVEKPVSVVKDPVVLPLNSRQFLSREEPVLSPLDIAGSPVTLTFSNADMRHIMNILWSCVDYSSYRTDYRAAAAFAGYFTDNLRRSSEPDYAGRVAGGIPMHSGIAEVVYGDPDWLYTARFAAAFPEIAGRNMGAHFSYLTNPDRYASDGELYAAAGYLTLAALGQSVLPELRERAAALGSEPDQAAFRDNYYDRMRMLCYAAALCAIGDDAGAAALMSRYPEGDGLNSSFARMVSGGSDLREQLDTMYLYINTTIDPVKAYDYLKNKAENKYISDVCEKINFIKKCVPIGGTTSEIRYTLNGVTVDVALSNFLTETISVTKEQYEALNLRWVSGTTGVRASFYGGAGNLDASRNRIAVEKAVTPGASENGVYDISFTVTLPEDAKPGYYTLMDRVPSNMRYLPKPGGWGGGYWASFGGRGVGYWVDSQEKQVVNIGFFYTGDNTGLSGRTFTVGYQAAKAMDFDALAGPAYVGRGFRMEEIWGGSK